MIKQISIIIPHYNSPKSLDKLLSTIPAYNDIEIIAVDDHSDKFLDEYKKLYKKWGMLNPNIVFLKNQSKRHNAGMSRNIGLRAATGKWVLFADSDDIFLPGFYQTIQTYFNSSFDIVFFIPTSFNSKTGELGERHKLYKPLVESYLDSPTEKNSLALRLGFEVPWSKLFSQNFLKSIRVLFDETRVANDVMFSTKSGLLAKSITASANAIYSVTDFNGGLTSNKNKKDLVTRRRVANKKLRFLFVHLNTSQRKDAKVSFTSFLRTFIPWNVQRLFRKIGNMLKMV